MAINTTTRRFNPSDYKGAPDWFTGRFLSALNLFTEPVFSLINGLLSFQQNFNAQIYDFSLTAGATADLNKVQFTKTISGPPIGLTILSANKSADPSTPLLAAISHSWYVNGNTVYITAIAGLTNGQAYTFRVMLF